MITKLSKAKFIAFLLVLYMVGTGWLASKSALGQEEDLTQLEVDPTGLCQKGTKFNALDGYCAPVFDKRDEFLKNSEEIPPEEKVDLINKRIEINGSYMPYNKEYIDKLIADGKINVKNTTNQANHSATTSSVPCSTAVNAGTTYRVNTLPARNVGELQTYMIVHPHGVGQFVTAIPP